MRPPAGSLRHLGSELLISEYMWQANKWGIIALAVGLAAVGAVYWYFHSIGDTDTADKVGSTGLCAVLFIVGLGSYLSARNGADE